MSARLRSGIWSVNKRGCEPRRRLLTCSSISNRYLAVA